VEGAIETDHGARSAARPEGADSNTPTFRQIFDTELSFVWNALRRFGVADRDLEDVAHEVFVVVDRHLAEYDPARPLRPWLFAIAFRCASDYRRRARHRHETLTCQQVDRTDPSETADVRLVRTEERNLARRALLSVPDDRRAVVILHDFEDFPMNEVAAALGIPIKTAYSRLRLGREELVASARRLRKQEEGR
jgi:RNA polymerase sigma-70 factor (ECF subfamily)